MLAEQIVRAELASRPLPGCADVREFAARALPREDLLWVAQAARRVEPAPRVGLRARWGTFWRSFGTPKEAEAEPDGLAGSAPTQGGACRDPGRPRRPG